MPRRTEWAQVLHGLQKQLGAWKEFRRATRSALSQQPESDEDIDVDFDTLDVDLDVNLECDLSISSDSEPEVISKLRDWLIEVSESRYFNRPSTYRRRLSTFFKIEQFTTDEFKRMFRLSRESFQHVLDAIIDHPVFINHSNNPQRPIRWQLFVALHHYGTPPSRTHNGRLWEVSHSTVDLYVQRVNTALLSLQKQYIQWPKPKTPAYDYTTRMHHLKYGFPDCLGFIDGSTIAVGTKPETNGERYFTRKKDYALNATIIVDGNTKILWANVGSMAPCALLD